MLATFFWLNLDMLDEMFLNIHGVYLTWMSQFSGLKTFRKGRLPKKSTCKLTEWIIQFSYSKRANQISPLLVELVGYFVLFWESESLCKVKEHQQQQQHMLLLNRWLCVDFGISWPYFFFLITFLLPGQMSCVCLQPVHFCTILLVLKSAFILLPN